MHAHTVTSADLMPAQAAPAPAFTLHLLCTVSSFSSRSLLLHAAERLCDDGLYTISDFPDGSTAVYHFPDFALELT